NPFCIFQAETNMMQKALLFFLLLTGIIAVGQSKYMTKTGSMSFEASQPTFEPIEASHTAVSALLNVETGELAVLALVRGFRFPLALMEEHFNENYIESHKYPKTSFKGSILNFDPNALSNQPLTVQLTGELSMHGVTNTINVEGRMTKIDGLITLESSFAVKTSDYAIEIPSLVRKQIDENVQIEVSLPLQPKQ
ncbi:MAG: YceI family protein, partial [Flavobacteriaceae bacterium]